MLLFLVSDATSASLYLVFHSHVIADASPPTCTIKWEYSYLVPSSANYRSSLLPGCATSDSREGFHLTYYWFYIMDWSYGGNQP
jgi:secretion-regulating guanine nucleotide exchange factor